LRCLAVFIVLFRNQNISTIDLHLICGNRSINDMRLVRFSLKDNLYSIAHLDNLMIHISRDFKIIEQNLVGCTIEGIFTEHPGIRVHIIISAQNVTKL